MNRAEVLDQLNPLVEGEVRNFRTSEGARIGVGADVITLRPHRGARLIDMAPSGVKGVTHFVGLPLKLAQELSPSTFSAALSELLERIGKYSLIVKDDKVVNVIPYGAQTAVNPERLLNTIEGAMPVEAYNRLTVIKEKATATLEVVGVDTKPIVRGDLVRAGVKLDFSPMGTIAPSVQSYAEVLACTNGSTSNVVLSNFSGGNGGGGEGDSVWQFFRSSIRKAYGSFDTVVNQWKKLQAENIPAADRARILAALLERAKIKGEVADAVMAMAVERPPRNAWDMHNLITFASTHLLTAPAQVDRAQDIAAEFADESTHAKSCPLCHRRN